MSALVTSDLRSANAHVNGVSARGPGQEVPELAGPHLRANWSSFHFAKAVGGGPIALLRQWSGRTARRDTSGLFPRTTRPQLPHTGGQFGAAGRP
ncbi:MAG: hypothetical protein ACYDEA_12070 [Candidatus Dormibacteria bacterium]